MCDNKVEVFMFRKLFFSLMFVAIYIPILSSQVFQFQYISGNRYEMRTQVAEDIFIDGEYSHTSRMHITEFLSIAGFLDGQYQVVGDYLVSEDTSSLGVAYQLKQEYQDNIFYLSRKGEYFQDLENFMPVKRNFPYFKPDKISRGTKWFAPSYEMHDFQGEPFGIDYPYEIPGAVSYHYAGIIEKEGKSYQRIVTRVSILNEPKPVPVRYRLYPIKISGFNEGVILWDGEKGLIHSIDENFDINFELSDGQIFRYRGESHSTFEKMVKLTDAELAELARIFGSNNVELNPKWVKITLDNIKFGPDDYQLSLDELEKLDLIAEQMAKYKGRTIKIVGHTAMAGSMAGRVLLSEKRAAVVRDYLIKKEAVVPELVTIEGKGAVERLDKSGAKKGMARNRRVEIYIYVR